MADEQLLIENEPSRVLINITVKSLTGSNTLEVQDNVKVKELRQILATQNKEQPDKVVLVYAGKILKDEDTLENCKPKNNPTICMVIKKATNNTNNSTLGLGHGVRTSIPSNPAQFQPLHNPVSQVITSGINEWHNPPNIFNPPANIESQESPQDSTENENRPSVNPLSGSILSNILRSSRLLSDNPQVQDLLNQNPAINQLITNPDLLPAFPTLNESRLDRNTNVTNNMNSSLLNPVMEYLLNNTEMMSTMMASNPQIRNLLERNPEINHVLNNPDLLRQMMEMASNPSVEREMIRINDRALSNIESIPEGYNALQRMYHDIEEPIMQSLQANPFAGLIAPEGSDGGNPQQGVENRAPLPNPWNPAAGNEPASDVPPTMGRSFPNIMNPNPDIVFPNFNEIMQNLSHSFSENPENFVSPGALPTSAQPSPCPFINNMSEQLQNFILEQTGGENEHSVSNEENDHGSPLMGEPINEVIPHDVANRLFNDLSQNNTEDFESEYVEELEQLSSMGFTNRDANLRVLIATDGDITTAIDKLLQLGQLSL